MLRAIIYFSTEQRFFVVGLVLLLVGVGLWALSTLPIDAFPDLTNNQVNIITDAPGMAAEEVEQLVTFAIEGAMMGIPSTEEVRSISKFGLSLITIVFADHVDTYLARQLVNERLSEAKTRIPEGLEPTMGPVATAFGEIYQYVVEGEGYTAMELKTIHDWNVKFQLRTVPGVNEVNSWGGFIQQYHVLVDPDRLLAYRLTLHDVFAALAESNQNFGGSFIEHGAEAYTVRGLGLFESLRDIEVVVVKSEEGVPVLIRDLARVEVQPAVRQGAVTKDGEGEVVSGMVIMTKGENSRNVIARVKERVEAVQATLPAGVRIRPFYDQTELVGRTTRTVATNLIEGGLLVTIVLFLFLHNVRAALIVALVIPLSMLVAFIGMRIFGVSANLMSLGAIDFGLIVDGSVVMMENFVRRLRGESGEGDTMEIVRESALEVARPIVFSITIIISVYVPIMALEGMAARMFQPMALTVVLAVFGSLVLALTFVPAVTAMVARHIHPSPEPLFDRVRNTYRRLLAQAMAERRKTVGGALVLVTVAIASMPYLGTEFMPELDEGALLIETFRLPSVSLSESVAMATRVEQVVREFPEVTTVVTKIGRPDLATEAMGIYQGDLYVLLKPPSEWTTADNREDLIDAIDEKLASVPGVVVSFTQPLAMRLDEVISGVRSDVAVKLFGDDFEALESQAERIRRVVEQVRGSADVQVEPLSGAAELRINVNRTELARYGLRVRDVAEFVETAIGGRHATQVIEGRRRIDVVVRLPEERRGDPRAVRALLITTPSGERVPLERVAKVEVAEGPEVVSRENAQRRIVIQSNVRGRDIGSFVAEAQAAIDAEIDLLPGYHITWGGEFEKQQQAMERLSIVVPLAIFFIFLLIFATFNSLPQTVLIMLILPFSMVGGVGALWARGLHLSLSASVGFIALFGIAVMNGLVLVSYINRLRDEGSLLKYAVIEGASVRLRPVLMTSIVATLGFLPMATSTQAGAEVQRPLATVVIGGLVTSTLLTLFVLPTLYEWLEEVRARKSMPQAEAR
ncbi:MAG: CusA/CzcA family heavy metal efflux RND transporter [Acidobacteriota bacterium]|nr:MAG: CusA/CzcA family heavy metal efflux RND transporter [Acidobacteriota bacterium]